MDWSKVEQNLREATVSAEDASAKRSLFHREVAPGGVLLVGVGGEILFHQAFGCRSLIPEKSEASIDTVYDIASLTKVLVTTTLLMRLVDSGKLDLDSRLSRILQTFGTYGKEQITTRQLLSHCSGLPAHQTFYKQIAKADSGEKAGIMRSRGATEMIYNEIYRMQLQSAPGKTAVYSDLGFILLANLIELLHGGKSLERLAQEEVFAPLGLRSTGYIDLSRLKRRGVEPITDIIAPTNECPWRKRMICGEVQDENAWAMGGIAGHAGIFSTALDLHLFATEMIDCFFGRGRLINSDVVKYFWTRDGAVSDSTWALGWDTPSREGSSSGKFFSADSVGHLGYTGCSLWIDPSRELDVILLTNRVHPSVDNQLIKQFRPLIHDSVMAALGVASE